jgi:hypothetical protein
MRLMFLGAKWNGFWAAHPVIKKRVTARAALRPVRLSLVWVVLAGAFIVLISCPGKRSRLNETAGTLALVSPACYLQPRPARLNRDWRAISFSKVRSGGTAG